MIQTMTLAQGVTLRCFPADKFKQSCLSFQLVRPMAEAEVAQNALIPAILLRGTKKHPDLRAITRKLDDLYGASVSALVRRIGDYQTTGLYCAFIADKYALDGDRVLAPMVDFLRELLLEPVLEDGGFNREFTESEKRNLILTIESERNDKRVYANTQLLRTMCRADSFGIPRLGTVAQASAIDHKALYAHYQRILRESAVEIFYVGPADIKTVASLLQPIFAEIQRNYGNLPAQTPFRDGGGSHRTEEMEVAQAKLCMGFTTPITNRAPEFAAMQVLNTVFGSGMTSKLFMNVREKMSLCYSIGSGYYGSKGILTVSAGIDADKEPVARAEILRQLDACRAGEISPAELKSAKEAILSSLRGVHDSPGAIENFHGTAAISGLPLTRESYMAAIEAVTVEDAAAAARTVTLHSSYVLKGVTA